MGMIGLIITLILLFLMAVVATDSVWWAAGIVGFMVLYILLPLVWMTVIAAFILGALVLVQSRPQ